MPNHSSNYDELTEQLDRLRYNLSFFSFLLSELKAQLEMANQSGSDNQIPTSIIQAQKTKDLNMLTSFLNNAIRRDPSLGHQDNGELCAEAHVDPKKELLLKACYLQRIITSTNVKIRIIGDALEELCRIS